MAATIALNDIGVQLRREDSSSKKYAVCVDITGIPSLGSEPDTIEVTRLVSDVKEYILGRQGQEKLAFPYNYTKENWAKVQEFADNKTPSNFLLELPDGSGFKFGGTASTHLDSSDGALRAVLTIAPNSMEQVEDITGMLADEQPAG